MSKANNIVAITLGPIYDTMQLMSKPAGLWASSYLFSYIAREIVSRLEEECSDNVIIPYFDFKENDKSADWEMHSCGIGYYHDRIIVRNVDSSKVFRIIENTKTDIANNISDSLNLAGEEKADCIEYIQRWVQIEAVEFPAGHSPRDNGNAVLFSSGYLDALELQRFPVSMETKNYMALFLNNDTLKDSFLVKELYSWQLRKKNGQGIMSIPEIARGDGEEDSLWKRHHYYALINSDGDHMGNVLNTLHGDEALRNFSLACQNYTTSASRAILNYGGIVVYAGGDDLQFLAPLTYKDKNIIGLLSELTRCFREAFNRFEVPDGSDKPTVSFGVEICYEKFPLYEALNESYSLLRNAKEGGRDAAAIRLRKHSGQTIEFLLRGIQQNMKEVAEQLGKLLGLHLEAPSDMESRRIVSSVTAHLRQFQAAFRLALTSEIDTQNFFNNFFNNAGQQKAKEYLNILSKTLFFLNNGVISSFADKDNSSGSQDNSEELIYMVKFLQFFGERGLEEE